MSLLVPVPLRLGRFARLVCHESPVGGTQDAVGNSPELFHRTSCTLVVLNVREALLWIVQAPSVLDDSPEPRWNVLVLGALLLKKTVVVAAAARPAGAGDGSSGQVGPLATKNSILRANFFNNLLDKL